MEWFTLFFIFYFCFIVNPSPPLLLRFGFLDSIFLSSDSRRSCSFLESFSSRSLFSAATQGNGGEGFGLPFHCCTVFFRSFQVFFSLPFPLRGLFVPAPLRFIAIYIGSSFISIISYLLDYCRSPALLEKEGWGAWVMACGL